MIEGIACVVAVVLSLVISVAGDRSAKKRKQAFWDRYGSFEGFRNQVDQERIQGVRRKRGDVAAMKAVRDEYPYVSLVMAKRYVEELPA
ncbi:hypothetical protein [Streptomyces griseus]|uniref:hypothetical protein n=1 Tax=Streptomyces griseus TaxID=1911 RepID=UPI00056CB6E0|nr:hypothetical protein [Streptomyces griseus]